MSWFNLATDPWLWEIRRECRWHRRRISSCWKLEASREDSEVDCVLTTAEVVTLVAEHGGLSRVYLHPELAGHPLLLPYYRKARPRHVRNCTARAVERLELARANPERGFPEFERACFV